MSLWQRIMEDIEKNGISISSIEISDIPSNTNTIRFRTEAYIETYNGGYNTQSYIKHPGNKTGEWSDYYKTLIDTDTSSRLNGLADSKNIQDILVSTAVISAIYSPKVDSWPHKYEADVTELIKKGETVLFADNPGIDFNIKRPLKKFIAKMVAEEPQELYILKDEKIYWVDTSTRKMTDSDINIQDISPGRIFLDNCFCSSIKQMDNSIKELFEQLSLEEPYDVALFGPLIVIDPDIIFDEYKEHNVTTYATSKYDFDDMHAGSKQHGKKNKMICTPENVV